MILIYSRCDMLIGNLQGRLEHGDRGTGIPEGRSITNDVVKIPLPGDSRKLQTRAEYTRRS